MNKYEVLELLNKCHSSPQKKYGQNFFVNQELLNKTINQLQFSRAENVLEIGSGLGALTEVLDKHFNKVLGVEIDNSLFNYLSKKYNNHPKIKIINNDILKVSIKEIEEYLGNQIIVIANIPYNITTDIILRLLPLNIITDMVILLQIDVAEKFANNKIDTSSLAIINYYGDVEILAKVAKENFYPIPNVDSAFIRIKKKSISQNIKLEEFFNRAFKQKRKMLRNNLLQYYPNINKALSDLNLKLDVRIEELNLEKIVNLFYKLEGVD